jgi:dihydrofolate synthase/folylpolyglutamate synthase
VSPLPALARLESLSPRGMRLGLASIDVLCGRLGRPERRVPSVLIAGTNGKGSTAAALSSIGRACGLRAGLYTSPHLICVTERVRVEEKDVSGEELDGELARVFRAADRAPEISITYFEALTAAAFCLFAARDLELAILEVGLGGRLDATNVVPAELAVVTSIGLDHTQELGSTLEAIAREKAGIFRKGRPALVRAGTSEALDALRAAGRAAGALWHEAADELAITACETSLSGTRFTLETPLRRIGLETPLPGRHQAWNAALAVRAAELLPDRFARLGDAALATGVASTRWPGRLERLPARGRTVLLDGCHNAEGAAALAGFLDESGLAGGCPLVFGALEEKPIEEIARLLFPRVTRVLFVETPSPRAATAAQLERRVATVAPSSRRAESLEAALEDLLAPGGAETIIVAGSLYLVGQARRVLLGGNFGKGCS